MDPHTMSGSERWAGLEPRLLIAFVAVVDEESFTGAARRLGYTQSGISQQIAALERIVERKLLVRQAGGRRPIELTPAGEALLHHSRILLGQLDLAYEDVVGREEGLASTVRVASFSGVAVQLVPVIERVLREQTSLRLELIEAHSDEDILNQLESRKADFGLAVLPVPPRFTAVELGSDPYVAVVAANSPLADTGEVTVDQLVGQTLLGVRHSAHEELVEALLAAGGLDGTPFTRYDDNRLIQTLVRAGNGIAIVPSRTIFLPDASVRVLTIRADLPPTVIALVQARDVLLGAAAREFKQLVVPLCRRVLASPASPWPQAEAS